jgi:rfaE bifunctional protein kinase chain/domain
MKSKTVFISGNFNILHPGHLRLFRFSKELADKLIVGVISDDLAGFNSLVSEELRLESVQSNSFVDDSFIISESLENSILKLKPDFILKGKEHENNFNIEDNLIKEYGGKLVFSSGEVVFSSFDLIKKSLESKDKIKFEVPYDFLKRHSISKQSLSKLINKFSSLNILVIGDLIIDEYITCEPLGMSQEDPTIVVKPINSNKYIGGAGIVAAHAAGLGANVNYITISGEDHIKDFAINELNKYGVKTNIFVDETRPTTLKQRFRTKGKTLLRVSHLHQNAINSKIQKEILLEIKNNIDQINLLIFSDFNYGRLPTELVNEIIEIANKNKIMMIADSQSSSQVGDISRFKGMSLITPTEREARISLRDNESGLVVLAERLRKNSISKNVFLKIGEEGVLVHAETSATNTWLTDRIPALNNNPKDVAGAGDSMMITSAMILASGGNIWEAACIGSIAAAIQVGRIGNVHLTIEELGKHFNTDL